MSHHLSRRAALAAAPLLPAWAQAKPLRFAAVFSDKDIRAEMLPTVKVKILGPTFFGARQVGLKPKKKIATPADMAGIKLRMPPGDAWQLLGRSIGANPTPMAYAETYTGLQTGAIDGQGNPLPNVQNMKFYEVMSQLVLTSHLVAFDLLTINLKTWQAMSPATQAKVQAAADKAFREHAQKVYLASDEAKTWPAGLLDKINAM